MRPLGLDLFCGGGGASRGYADAGFEMVGVDLAPMPRYPYFFCEGDALIALDNLVTGIPLAFGGDDEWLRAKLSDFTFIHASPPCQRYSKMSYCRPGLANDYPDLVEPTRDLLQKTGLPYILENVPQAPLRSPVTLCGSQFDRETYMERYGRVGLRRHRDFETNWPMPDAGPHDHSLRAVGVYGHGPSGNHMRIKGPGLAAAAKTVMGIDWMTRDELDESLPPCYTEHIGRALYDYLVITDQVEERAA